MPSSSSSSKAMQSPETGEDASRSREELSDCLHDLSQAEEQFGPTDVRVAQCLRRMALVLVRQGRSSRALPIWLRILELERPLLGGQHPDVLALEAVVIRELRTSSLGEEAISAYACRLEGAPAPSLVVPFSCYYASAIVEEQEEPTRRASLGAAAASLGTAAAAGIGGAVVSGAMHLGFSAVTSTFSIAADAAGTVANLAAQKATVAVLCAAAAPEPVVAVAAAVAGIAGSSAVGAARVSACAAMGLAQQVSVALVSNAASSAISYAGRKSIDGASQAIGLLQDYACSDSGAELAPAGQDVHR